MMNKIEEYLKNLDFKNRAMLYLSVFILFFVIYYNFNYNYLETQIQKNTDKIMLLKSKIGKTFSLKRKLAELKKIKKLSEKKNLSLKEDLKYIKILVNTDNVMKIKDKKFLDILKRILQNASDNSIAASYTITKNIKDYKIYTIKIKGAFIPSKFKNFYKFIKNIEAVRNIKIIKKLVFSYKKEVNFEIVCEFWSIK